MLTPTLSYYALRLRRDFVDYCHEQLQAIGLSHGLQFFIIYIGKYPDCSPSTLSEALKMDTGHVTRSLAKLEQSGFVRQLVNPADRRARVLRLEPAGEEALRVIRELFSAWDRERLRELSESEREQLLSLLSKLVPGKDGESHA